MKNKALSWARASRCITTAVALALLGLGGCDFDVTNPGPLQDATLDEKGAHEALVNGAVRAIAEGLDEFGSVGAAAAREIQASGSTGFAGITASEELGVLREDEQNSQWNSMHEGRWIAEHAIERIEGALGSEAESYAPLARAYMWAGYANRILGENVCWAVFDGGAPEPYTNHLDRAIGQFTSAIEIGQRAGEDDVAMAALAGRAAAHLYIGNFGQAASDAGNVPLDFVHVVDYQRINHPDYDLIKALSDGSVRAISTWNTVFENYYLETGDPRAAWGFDDSGPGTRIGENARSTYGDIPFFYPLKYFLPRTAEVYTSLASKNGNAMRELDVNLATGREMQLIIAETMLEGVNWQGAMGIINQRRTGFTSETTSQHAGGAPLVAFAASNLEEAWTALKRERGIELWMEARRLGDMRRWRQNNTPGELDPLEYIADELVERFGVPREQHVCFPIGLDEVETNENIPLDFNSRG